MIVTGGLTTMDLPPESRVGGILNSGSLTLRGGTTVRGNGGLVCGGQCAAYKPWTGGVINSGELTLMDRASISENDGGAGVGGVLNYGDLLLRGRSTIAANSGGGGGGIYNTGNVHTTDSSSIVGNRAYYSATGSGGGIRNSVSGNVTIEARSEIKDNSAHQLGGGVYNEGTMVIRERPHHWKLCLFRCRCLQSREHGDPGALPHLG
jgi:hypothetical protein